MKQRNKCLFILLLTLMAPHSQLLASSTPVQSIDLALEIFMPEHTPFATTGNIEKDLELAMSYLDNSRHLAIHADTLNRYCMAWNDNVSALKNMRMELMQESYKTGDPRIEFDIAYICGWLALNTSNSESEAYSAETRERFARLMSRNFSDAWIKLFGSVVLASLPDISLDEKGDLDFYRELERAVFTAGDDAQLNFLTAEAFKLIGYTNPSAHKIAAIQYEKALSLSPGQHQLVEKVLNTYREFSGIYQMYSAAIPFWLEEHILQKILELEPKNAIAHNNLAYMYSMTAEHKQTALIHARKAVELEPDNHSYLDTLGWTLYRNGKISEGEKHIRKSLGIQPAYSSALSHLAMLLIETGREVEAIPYYESLLEIDPLDATALNNLGYILADNDMEHEKALELCKKAVSIEPDNPIFLDSLAWALYRNDRYEEAIEILETISAGPDADPAFLDHLAAARKKAGQPEAALKTLHRLIRKHPDYPGALERYAEIWKYLQ